MKKMTEEQIRQAVTKPLEFDESFLDDPDLPIKMANDDLPEGVHLAEQVAVTVFSTPNGPRIYLSGTVDDPDRVSFLLNAAHSISLQNAVDFYLGVDPNEGEDEDDDGEFIMTREDFLEGSGGQTPEELDKAADEAGHMVVKDGYVGGGAMTAGDIT